MQQEFSQVLGDQDLEPHTASPHPQPGAPSDLEALLVWVPLQDCFPHPPPTRIYSERPPGSAGILGHTACVEAKAVAEHWPSSCETPHPGSTA